MSGRGPTGRRLPGLLIAPVFLAAAGLATATEDPAPPADLASLRVPARSLAEAERSFSAPPGFRVELAAAEPLVSSPVALAFDEDGRLFVVEMRDYPEPAPEPLGRVRLLTDRDEDGVYDASTVFLAGLAWPTAVHPHGGGVFVGVAPDLIYARDLDGDGQADERRVVFTGFGRQNVQGLLNNFQWGLDQRLHVAGSTCGGDVRRVGDPPGPVLALRGRGFSFDPLALDLAPETGGGQHGMAEDDFGRRYLTSNSDPVRVVLAADRYLARNPRFAPENATSRLVPAGTDVHRASPIEPWRVARTRLRVAGLAPGPIEGGGRASGYFTGATGIAVYRGDAWPAEYRGQLFVGEVASNAVCRLVIEGDGIVPEARKPEEGREFLTSTDSWFRPVQLANAPDGALYIADMCREVVEHPESLPPSIKQGLDLGSGRDRGRIWRLVPEGWRRRPPPRLGKAGDEELAALLAHANGWHRDTAARLLHERRGGAARDAVRRLAAASPAPETRVLALHVARGLGVLEAADVARALEDPHPRVREQAVRLAEPLARETAVHAGLLARAADPDPRVRYQLAFTLGELGGEDRIDALAALARRDGQDPWTRTALLTSLAAGAESLLARLARAPAGEPPLAPDLAAALARLAPGPEGAALVAGLVEEGLRHAPDRTQPLSARLVAIRALELAPGERPGEVLAELLAPGEPPAVQIEAIQVLGRRRDDRSGPVLVAAWPRLSPAVRSAAVEAITARAAWAGAFLDACERGDIQAAEIEPGRLQLLAAHPDRAVGDRARRLAAKSAPPGRQEVLAKYAPALGMAGDPARGKEVFLKACSACHQLEGEGHEVGPGLGAAREKGREAILQAVLDPNREVQPPYLSWLALLADGRTVTGRIAAETAAGVTFLRAGGIAETVPRGDLVELRSSGLSLMPEGLEREVDVQAMADLLAYLAGTR